MLLFQSQFDTKEAYHKAIGYNEDDGGIESEESYISRVESYMRLYGALVQVSPHIFCINADLARGYSAKASVPFLVSLMI